MKLWRLADGDNRAHLSCRSGQHYKVFSPLLAINCLTDVFPPIIVFFDGTDYWNADGYHRIGAAKVLDWTEIEAEVREGTQRDAWLYGIGANAKHGLRRTQADKHRAITALLADKELGRASDRKIARLNPPESPAAQDRGLLLHDEIAGPESAVESDLEISGGSGSGSAGESVTGWFGG